MTRIGDPTRGHQSLLALSHAPASDGRCPGHLKSVLEKQSYGHHIHTSEVHDTPHFWQGGKPWRIANKDLKRQEGPTGYTSCYLCSKSTARNTLSGGVTVCHTLIPRVSVKAEDSPMCRSKRYAKLEQVHL